MAEPPLKRPRQVSSVNPQVLARASCPNGVLYHRAVKILEHYLDFECTKRCEDSVVEVNQDIMDEIARAFLNRRKKNNEFIVSGHAFCEGTTAALVKEAIRLAHVPLLPTKNKDAPVAGVVISNMSGHYMASLIDDSSIGYLYFSVKDGMLLEHSLKILAHKMENFQACAMRLNERVKLFLNLLMESECIRNCAKYVALAPEPFVMENAKDTWLYFGTMALLFYSSHFFDQKPICPFVLKKDFIEGVFDEDEWVECLKTALNELRTRNEYALKEFGKQPAESVVQTEGVRADGTIVPTAEHFSSAVDALWAVPSWIVRAQMKKSLREIKLPEVPSTRVAVEEAYGFVPTSYAPPECELFSSVQKTHVVIAARTHADDVTEIIIGFPSRLPHFKRANSIATKPKQAHAIKGFHNAPRPESTPTIIATALAPTLVCAYSSVAAADLKNGCAELKINSEFTRLQTACVNALVQPAAARKTGQAQVPFGRALHMVVASARSRQVARKESAPPAVFRGVLYPIEDIALPEVEKNNWINNFEECSIEARKIAECHLNALDIREQVVFAQRCLGLEIICVRPNKTAVRIHPFIVSHEMPTRDWTIIVSRPTKSPDAPWNFFTQNNTVAILTPTEAQDALDNLQNAQWMSCDEQSQTLIQSIGGMIETDKFSRKHWNFTGAAPLLRMFGMAHAGRVGEWNRVKHMTEHALRAHIDARPRRFAGWISDDAATGDFSKLFANTEMRAKTCAPGNAVLYAPIGTNAEILNGESGTVWFGCKNEWLLGWRFDEAKRVIIVNMAFSETVDVSRAADYSFSCRALDSVADRIRRGPQKVSEQMSFAHFHPATLGKNNEDTQINIFVLESAYERGDLRQHEVNLISTDKEAQRALNAEQCPVYCFLVPYGYHKVHEIVFTAKNDEFRALLWDANEYLV